MNNFISLLLILLTILSILNNNNLYIHSGKTIGETCTQNRRRLSKIKQQFESRSLATQPQSDCNTGLVCAFKYCTDDGSNADNYQKACQTNDQCKVSTAADRCSTKSEARCYEPLDTNTASPITTSPTTTGETFEPTSTPTSTPSNSPTEPTKAPTQSPVGTTFSPTTSNPTTSPTESNSPSFSPSRTPTASPITSSPTLPTKAPTRHPTTVPTKSPTDKPTGKPSSTPTKSPTKNPHSDRDTPASCTDMGLSDCTVVTPLDCEQCFWNTDDKQCQCIEEDNNNFTGNSNIIKSNMILIIVVIIYNFVF